MKNTQKWLKKNKLSIGLATIFLIVGFTIGLGTQFSLGFKLYFDEKIDTAEFFSAICNIILVWVVVTILDKGKQAEQNAKGILLRRVEELYNLTIKISDKSSSGNFLLTEATSATKKINLIIDNVFSHLTKSDLTVDETHKSEIKTQTNKLNDLMTNTPVNSEEIISPAVRVEEGKLYFSKERILEIDNNFDKLRELITDLELKINDA